MAKKFIPLEDAAKMIGISPDALNDLRGRHDISGYRDGASWKFKEDDVQRLIDERKAGSEQSAAEFEELDENVDSILLSEVELGQSTSSTSSTVIGKSYMPPSTEDDIQIAQPGQRPADKATEMSDVRLASDSDLVTGGSGLSTKFDDLDTLDLDLPDAEASGISLGSSAVSLPEDLELEDSTVSLDAPRTADPLSGGGTSAIELASEADDDLVLGGSSGPGSDITRSAGDSGISLVDPSDSGISLEEPPLELGGSSVESLELGEDEVVLEEEGDPEAATLLKADDDFLLTPLEDTGEEADSGSQVIALDEEGEFDTGGFSDTSGGGMMLEEDMGGDFGGPARGAGMAPTAAMAAQPAGAVAQAPEAQFSIANVLALSACTLFLVLTGMMMSDLLRNMWSWNGPYSVNSPLMDTIVGWFQK